MLQSRQWDVAMSGRFLLFPWVLPCVTPQLLLRSSGFLRALPVPPLLFLLGVKTKLVKGWIIWHPELSLFCHCTLRASYAPTDGQIGPEGFLSSLNPPPNPPTLPFVHLCLGRCVMAARGADVPWPQGAGWCQGTG